MKLHFDFHRLGGHPKLMYFDFTYNLWKQSKKPNMEDLKPLLHLMILWQTSEILTFVAVIVTV